MKNAGSRQHVKKLNNNLDLNLTNFLFIRFVEKYQKLEKMNRFTDEEAIFKAAEDALGKEGITLKRKNVIFFLLPYHKCMFKYFIC